MVLRRGLEESKGASVELEVSMLGPRSNPAAMSSLSQGVQEQVYKRGNADVLHEGDGGGHHPLRPRPPCGCFLQDIQDRCKTSYKMCFPMRERE